ncbi:hypothetical protein BKA61DRAFT_569197 [Leptodontidium sp. MPI-SDFR-AT-0119]|nr:hypothetical protein BKA61DRAFT_569197 [Leptodontidium sp. MPI-SDFR-AT-0119]
MRAAAFLSLLSLAVALPASDLTTRDVFLDQLYTWPAAVGDTVAPASRPLQMIITNIDNTKYKLEYFWPLNGLTVTATVSTTSGQQLFQTFGSSSNQHGVVEIEKSGDQFRVVIEN